MKLSKMNKPQLERVMKNAQRHTDYCWNELFNGKLCNLERFSLEMEYRKYHNIHLAAWLLYQSMTEKEAN